MKNFPARSFARWWLTATLFFIASCGGNSGNAGSTVTLGNTVPAANTAAPANTFTAILSGAQETPPIPSTATGTGTAIVDPVTHMMSAIITTIGINGTAAHIQQGAPGVSGPIISPLIQTAAGSGIWTTQFVLTEAQLSTLRAGNYYFNVCSASFPTGEIRGQIVQDAATGTSINGTGTNGINGANGIGSTGFGTTGTTGTIGIGTSATGTTGTSITGTGTFGTGIVGGGNTGVGTQACGPGNPFVLPGGSVIGVCC